MKEGLLVCREKDDDLNDDYMKMLSTLLALYEEIPPVTGESHHKGIAMHSFDASLLLVVTSCWIHNRIAGDSRKHLSVIVLSIYTFVYLLLSWKTLTFVGCV